MHYHNLEYHSIEGRTHAVISQNALIPYQFSVKQCSVIVLVQFYYSSFQRKRKLFRRTQHCFILHRTILYCIEIGHKLPYFVILQYVIPVLFEIVLLHIVFLPQSSFHNLIFYTLMGK